MNMKPAESKKSEYKSGIRRLLNKQTLRRTSLFGFTAFIVIVIVRHVLSGENGTTIFKRVAPGTDTRAVCALVSPLH